MNATDLATLDRIRHFNRFYTRQLGLLDEGLLGGQLTLTEARVLYELATHAPTTAATLRRELGLDAGYLSRLLKRFETDGLLTRSPSPTDARESLLALSAAGRAAFAPLERIAREQVAGMLAPLPPHRLPELLAAMACIEQLLQPQDEAEAYRLRALRVGDLGWLTQAQCVFYAQELGLNLQFEALVARIAADFVTQHDPARERAWIAERHGRQIGSIFLLRERDDIAKLRLLYVDGSARGLGVGRRLVEECVSFARATGYRQITLWTNGKLLAARQLYQSCGFVLSHEEQAHDYGVDYLSQTWTLDLSA